MPVTGKTPSAQRTQNKRVLRVHSKFSAAGELRNFFTSSSIPKFNDQLLEAYVKAIAPNYEVEHDKPRSSQNNSTQSQSEAIPPNDIGRSAASTPSSVASRSGDDDHNFERFASLDSSRKVYLQSGLFHDVQQNKKSIKPQFTFPLPASHTHALEKKADFLLPYSIYCPSRTKEPIWKNLKKSMLPLIPFLPFFPIVKNTIGVLASLNI